MNANTRFIEVVEELKSAGKVRDYKSFADSIGVSKSFLSDLKAGRKKVSVEVLDRMKNEYQEVDLTYIITGFKTLPPQPMAHSQVEGDTTTSILIDKLQQMAEEVGGLKQQLKNAQEVVKQLSSGIDVAPTDRDWMVKTAGDVDTAKSVPATKHSKASYTQED